MGKTRGVHETTPELRNRMVGMYEAGLGLRDIAAAVNCSQRTVKRWLNRFDKEGTVETRERCGRKRATTSEQDDAIIRLATQTPITAAKAVLPALGLSCSVDTIRERLHKAGIHNWSPSRKHMRRIPLGSEGESTTIQQAVWRPTGTQLGKKKFATKDPSAKNKKNVDSTTKKKQRPLKVRARDVYVGDGAPADALKQAQLSPDIVFIQQNLSQEQQQTSALPQGNNNLEDPGNALPNGQTEFGDPLCIVQPPEPQVYQLNPGLNVVQNWPLDLVQGSHHYPQGQQHSMSHEEQPPGQQQLQELHTQREQEHRAQQQHLQQQIQQQLHPHHHHHHHHHHHDLSQQQQQQQQQHQPQEHQTDHHILSQQEISPTSRGSEKILRTESCSSSSSSNDEISEGEDTRKDDSREDYEDSGRNERRKKNNNKRRKRKTKKKGGKAKGTLETSVEIRNRMIGMSEAGLSTLSIALAINRSERTVKRWLERWNKEGNVRTKERKGRRRITTKEQDEAIVAMATQHPLTAAKHVAPALGLNCSVDTIRERLHKAGIHSWKLGKKQGEGNAVHTVHLWQPSGNRPNKPKLPNEKRKKSLGGKKRAPPCGDGAKRVPKRKKTTAAEPSQSKIVPPANNLIPEPPSAMQFHDNGNLSNYVPGSEMMQHLPAQQASHVAPSAPGAQAPGLQAMQAMVPIMQQRPDCRMAPPIGPPVPGQNNPEADAYPPCMIGGSSHVTQMEQPDPLNYEPYIWSF